MTRLLGGVGRDTVLMRIGGESNPNAIRSARAGSDMYALLAHEGLSDGREEDQPELAAAFEVVDYGKGRCGWPRVNGGI